MDNITIKNGIPLIKDKEYYTYHMYSPDNTEYFMTIPNNQSEEYTILIDFIDVDFEDNDQLDQIIKARTKPRIDKIYTEYKNAIYVIPRISLQDFKEALEENDDRLYERLIKIIEAAKNNAYWSIMNAKSKSDKININPNISIIKQSDADIKLFWWLDIKSNNTYNQVELHEDTIEGKLNKPINPVPIDKPIEIQPKTRKKVPKGDGIHSTGYTNIGFITTVLVISTIMIIGLAYLIIR